MLRRDEEEGVGFVQTEGAGGETAGGKQRLDEGKRKEQRVE